jgi:hypothetical protein
MLCSNLLASHIRMAAFQGTSDCLSPIENLARRSLEKLLSWDFDKLIIVHGVCIEKDAKPFVKRAF